LKLEVQWLAYLANEAGILDSAKCLVLKHALGPEAELLAFGEKLIDRGYCTDVDTLQNLIEEAHAKGEAGAQVPNDPFEILQSTSKRTFGRRSPDADAPSPLRLSSTSSSTIQDSPLTTSIPSQGSPKPWKPSDGRRTLTTDNPFGRTGTNSHTEIREAKLAPISFPNPEAQPAHIPSLRSNSGRVQDEPDALPTIQAQPAPQASVVAASTPVRSEHAPNLTKERPEVSLEVEDEWPGFEKIASFSEQEARQCMVQLLLKSQCEGASDLHLCADACPFIRHNREVVYLGDHVLSAEEAKKLNLALLSEFQLDFFNKNHDLDYALSFNTHLRYRVNLMLHKDGLSGTYRLVPNQIRSLEELGFHEADNIRKLLTYHNGLIMVTGPMGSGKTATLAALIDEINRTRQDHLITVESPIEIVQHSDQCQITQREVGSHTNTFHSALKGALRQDPDIIVIGEMRDLETVEMAISASETGHLVIGTMHTSDAANTLNRLLDVFPAAQQTQIRSMVAESLKGIICQRLLPAADGGVEMAYELLLNCAAVGNLIRTNKADGLSNVIETGRKQGMILMDKSIFALWEAKRISDEVALANLVSRPMKQHILSGGQVEVEV